MGSSPRSNPAYVGEILIAELDVEDLGALEERLESFIDLGEDEELVVRAPGDDRVEVVTLREVSE